MTRVAVATSILLMLGRLRNHALVATPEHAPLGSYDPVGILMLTGDASPAPVLVRAAYVVAWIATFALLAGAWTRIAAAVSLAASLLTVSYAVSFTPDWPHDNNLPLLALLALQGTRGGDVAGVDGWLRRRRGSPPPPSDGYEWTPRLVQLICALMFLAAAAFKMAHAHFTLSWALSDNLRHQILAQFDVNHLPRTPVAEWLVAEPWRYRTAALLNLVNQLLPIVACVCVNRPRLRALFGASFVLEMVGIGLVMGLWDLHWLPLVAVFVDWSRLVAWIQRAPRVTEGDAMPMRARRRISTFVAAFVAYDVLVSFAHPRIDHRLRTYPFSTYPMFALIRARRPYDVHQDYHFVHGRFRVVGAGARATELEDWIHSGFVYRKLHRIDDPETLRTRLGEILDNLRRRYPGVPVDAVQLWCTVYHVPAYPAPPRLEAHDVGLMGELTAGGAWTSAMTRAEPLGGGEVALSIPVALDRPGARVIARVDGDLAPRPLPVERRGHSVVIAPPEGTIVMIALETTRPDGTPLSLLLARRSRNAWW
ncbi:MAG TPA: hypothetical protein VM261_07585 [Kofleriaceae bacterium]|nr:hypothetical protein [Kofleriaceae bacterium]